jgi:hypothetical protein
MFIGIICALFNNIIFELIIVWNKDRFRDLNLLIIVRQMQKNFVEESSYV